MQTEVVGKSISIKFSTYNNDDFWFTVSSLSEEQKAMPNLTIQVSLDRAIELRDSLTKIIDAEVSKLNRQIATDNIEQIATELGDVIDRRLPKGVV